MEMFSSIYIIFRNFIVYFKRIVLTILFDTNKISVPMEIAIVNDTRTVDLLI